MTTHHSTSWTVDTWRAAFASPRPPDERIKVTPDAMTSGATTHRAQHVGRGHWRVDYLAGQDLTYRHAYRAMCIAAALHDRGDAELKHIWKRGLGLSLRAAVGLAVTDSAISGFD
ncbi:hypothetical protein [Nocardia sp. NBC_00511]|uniref:hypothetical protein n=1 Tax=Nocardia sp. NBC_00511 TaxID=2903591 RepID=UPI002F911653